jgi:hypothetical protein
MLYFFGYPYKGDYMSELSKNYSKLLELTRECFGINKDDVYKSEDIKYTIILILEKYYPIYGGSFWEEFLIKKEETSFYYNKARERLILDREFRERYFMLKEQVERYL